MTIVQLNTLILIAKTRYGSSKRFLTHRQIAEQIHALAEEYGEIGEWSDSKVKKLLGGRYATYQRDTFCPIPLGEAVKRILHNDLSPNEFETIQGMMKKEVAPVGHSNS
jgi:hypothetical protein